jgi:hypothetical protein
MMFVNDVVLTTFVIFLVLNISIALLFWFNERLEQLCVTLDNPEKKQQAVLRVEALLGWYKWFIPPLVIDTAIEAEVYLIKEMQQKLSCDAPDEVFGGEGSE